MNQLNDVKVILLAYEEIKAEGTDSTRERLDRMLNNEQMNPLLKQPFLAMEDTVYGKKERYNSIVMTWKQYDGPVEDWVLLALIDTMEQMSKMIYEHYQALGELFKAMLKEYLNKETTGDIMAGLAVLKACRMDVILAEHYVKEGMRLINTKCPDAETETQIETHKTFKDIALIQWKSVRETWGLEDEN